MPHRRLALILGFAAAACRPAPVVVDTTHAAAPTSLVATGSATIAVAPDCADLALALTADAPRPADAIAHVQRDQAALITALHQRGVVDADLALSQLAVEPVYRYDQGVSTLTGFRARVAITVTTEQFDRLGPLMEAAAQAGASEMSSRFRRRDLETLRKEVRAQALAAAQGKARDTAATLGIALGAITAVSDTTEGALSSSEYFPTRGDGGGGLAAERQPLTVNVTLTYALGS